MNETREMIAAVKAGDLIKVKELLRTNPRLVDARSETGESAILLAVYHGHSQVVDVLLAGASDLDVVEASAAGRADRVAALLDEDHSLANAYAPDGFTPLGLAAFFGHREVVDVLLAHGADVNAVSRNATGYTALTGAVAHGHTEIAATLLVAGANVNHRYGQSSSPLHEAAANGNPQMVKLLLDHGAYPNARTDDGLTPLGVALKKGQEDVADLLRQHRGTE